MTLELLEFIRDDTVHLQGHQYQIIQVIVHIAATTHPWNNMKGNATHVLPVVHLIDVLRFDCLS